MKISLLIAFVIISSAAVNAQMLRLKPGQKFSYEAINALERKGVYRSKSFDYSRINYEVVKHLNQIYTIKVTPEQFLSNGRTGELSDSSEPFEDQPIDFLPIAYKVITTFSYELSVNEKGEILSIAGIPEIKGAILAKLKSLDIPDGQYQTHDKLAEMFIIDDYFISLSSVFNLPKTQSNSLTSRGLIDSYEIDTTQKNFSPSGVQITESHILKKFNLIIPNSTKHPFSSQLLTQAKDSLNYSSYSNKLEKASRKIRQLTELFTRKKGDQAIEEKLLKRLDTLDRDFAEDDYEYMGAKLVLLSYLLQGNRYAVMLEKMPYDYLPGINDVRNKLNNDLNHGNISNVKKAIELAFTKFDDKNLSRNLEEFSKAMHDDLGGLIYRLKSKDSLQATYNIIQQTTDLNIPVVTNMLIGMKTYVKAKLTDDQDELMKISNIYFDSAYDKASRYRVLIYDELLRKQIPDSIRSSYIDYTIALTKKKLEELKTGSEDSLDPLNSLYISQKNIVYKKNIADAYYRKSKLKKSSEQSYLQMAAEYMPSQQELIDGKDEIKQEYIFSPYVSYTDLYLASGKNTLNDEAGLTRYVELVIIEPERYSLLKKNYLKAYPEGNFKAFFSAALKNKLPSIPKFELTERLGKVVSNKSQQGKFVFVDFWGTWCGSCIAEIDKIEAAHLNNPNPSKLLVTTIACYDKKVNVNAFMAKRQFTYEVLMSDGKVEKDFKISSYPTKLLLLPNGTYLTISFHTDYKEILNKYLTWEL
ncbi:MAG: TlpA disulfide reductase family protein [Bacteroidota bacterium]